MNSMHGALTLAVLSAFLLIVALPAQAQTETVLYNFCPPPYYCYDGSAPGYGALTSDGAGNFYGTTISGGLSGAGTVFELSPNGSGGWNETVLYSFAGPYTGGGDGSTPYSSVTFDSAGNLYGTTYEGGAYGSGVVFELSLMGGSWTEKLLYSFCSAPNCADGFYPLSGLIFDAAGNLYGTTSSWTNPQGVVFELSPSGGTWTEQAIYTFDNDISYGYLVTAGLTMDAAGNLYGTTPSTVFELSPNGSGGWTPTVIYTFTGPPQDGWISLGTLAVDHAGNLYGTTEEGGARNGGTVFKLSPKKRQKGKWKERILYSFKGGNDGTMPYTGVVLDTAGNIYGTTVNGGKGFGGIVFELAAPVGGGRHREEVLWSFVENTSDGEFPMDTPVLDSAGNLYGMTNMGGTSDNGVVFEVSGVPSASATMLTSSPNPSSYGQAVTFTAVVTSRNGAPLDGETVKFRERTTVLGTGSLSGGTASFTTSTLPVGTHAIKAVYGGDLYFYPSTSKAVDQVVN